MARKLKRWFLPETPDVLGMLRSQMEVTIEGMNALVRWAETDGDVDAAQEVSRYEHLADEHKRSLRRALRVAFVTPIDPEDLFQISRHLDEVLNGAKNAVREAEVMAIGPDAAVVQMTCCLRDGVRLLFDGISGLEDRRGRTSTDAADAAVKRQRELERVYRIAMSQLLEFEDLREVMGRRELYRRFARISEDVMRVADRVWYATVKEM